MALQLPDFEQLNKPIFTSHSPDNQPTVSELSGYACNRKSLRHTDRATIQGIRIFSRYPDDSSRAPHKAINSLASLTGTSVSILGNAVIARSSAKNLQVPLGDDGHLILFRLDGEAIRIAVRSQSAAFVSGFRMGVLFCRSGSFGVPVWVQSSRREGDAQIVRFDSDETGLALTGKATTELQLTAFDWKNISCLDTSNARFALILLTYMMRQVCEQVLRLAQQIKYLCAREKSFIKNFSESNAGAIQQRMRDIQSQLATVAGQAESYS